MSHETLKDHESKRNGGKASPTGLFHSRSLGRDSDCSLDLGFKRLAINCGGRALWAKPANDSCLDSGCEYPRIGLFGGSSSIRQTPSGNSRGSPKVGSGLGEESPGIGNPSLALGWNFGYGVSEEVLGDLDPASASPELAPEVRLRPQKARVLFNPGYGEGNSSIQATAQKKLRSIMNGERAVVVFGDETGFSLHPRLGRLWMKRGSRIRVATKSQHRQRLNLFGWVEPLRGWYGFLRILKGDRRGFVKFLKALHRRFAGWRIYLYVDKAKWHHGPEIDSFLANHPHVDLEYLPTYHPELNLVDRLWKQLRYEVTTSKYFPSLDDILFAVRKQQRYWRPLKITSLCKITYCL